MKKTPKHTFAESKQEDVSVDVDPIQDVIILNTDFKWKEGRLSVLEIADGINNSGFGGYNALYGAGPNDERMFKEIAGRLASRFQFLYVIHHTTKGAPHEIPVAQWCLPNLRVFDTYFDFVDYIHREQPSIADSVVIVGESLGATPFNFAPRSVSEIKLFLDKQGIDIPVVNSPEMFKLADDKVVFAMTCPGGVAHSYLVSSQNFSEQIDLFLAASLSPYVVLKPPCEQKGQGVRIIRREELLAIQSLWQNNTPVLAQIPFLHTMLEQYGHFLLQGYVDSNTLLVEGAPYDPTGRAVLILYKTVAGRYTVEWVDAYWKLPKLSLAKGESQVSQISYSGENNRVFSAKIADSSKVAIAEAFTDFFHSPAPLFLSGLDFWARYCVSLSDEVKHYFICKLQAHGIDIPSVHIGKRLQPLGKRFSFGWGVILLRSLILMVQNNSIESRCRPDLKLCTEETDALFNYLVSKECVNTLLLPPDAMKPELSIMGFFLPHYRKLEGKIACSRSELQRLLRSYELVDASPLELAKGLRRAAALGKVEDLALFLERLEHKNIADNHPDKKYTALHLAVEKKQYSCVRLLLESGALYTIKNAAGKTVQEIIEEGEDGILKAALFGAALIAQAESSYRRALARMASLEIHPSEATVEEGLPAPSVAAAKVYPRSRLERVVGQEDREDFPDAETLGQNL